jgi:iron complex outermembrane receptor protein
MARYRKRAVPSFLVTAGLCAAAPGMAQTADATTSAAAAELDPVIVLGTSRSDATALSSLAPVDVITSEQLERTGAANLSEALVKLLPSANFPQGLVGGSGLLSSRSVSLSGLFPDHVLVLVNGKRRHTTSNIQTQSNWGLGSQPVNLTTVPISAIARVEVLRDGASAQYGSDAIAGVVNIILRQESSGGEHDFRVGKYSKGDGFTRQIQGWQGLSLPNEGFATLSYEVNKTDSTNVARGQATTRYYFPGDPREATINRNRYIGGPEIERATLGLNAELPVSAATRLYGFANYSHNDNASNYGFTAPNSNNNDRSVYPDGYQGRTGIKSDDFDGVVGLRHGSVAEGSYDFALQYGRNHIETNYYDTINPTLGLGAAAPRSWYGGDTEVSQYTATLDYKRELPASFLVSPLTLSSGLAYRWENYKTGVGEPVSYTIGGARIPDGPSAGQLYGLGSQGRPPADAVDITRHSYAAYLGAEGNPTERLSLGIAGRFENYSDFGNTATGKISGRYEFTPAIAVRSTLSSGFRAPTLGQLGLSSSSLVVNSTNTTWLTRVLPVNHPISRLLGATDLKPEKSDNISAGLVLQPSARSSVTLDAYQIKIRDRIAQSENFQGPNIIALLQQAGYSGVSSAAFFTNGLDTTTHGVDIVGKWQPRLPSGQGRLDLSAAFSYNKTEIDRIKGAPGLLAGAGALLVGRQQQGAYTTALPHTKLILGARYALGNWYLDPAVTLYGSRKLTNASSAANDQKFSAKWITNLEVGYTTADKRLLVAVGGSNIFDRQPEKLLPANGATGGTLYDQGTPWGTEGAFYYVRVKYSY